MPPPMAHWRGLEALGLPGCGIGRHRSLLSTLILASGRWSLHSDALRRCGLASESKRAAHSKRAQASAHRRQLDGCTLEAPGCSASPPVHRSSVEWMGLIDPALVLDWLRASAFVKDVRKMGPAAAAFSTIFANGLGVDARDLLDLAPKCCPELIRLARVRLDLVAVLLSRKMLQTMSDTCPNMNIYLFADASPQWRGLEMFAASMDIQDGQTILRRLLPVLSLDRVQLDALGKVMALLWQVFLVCGPSYKVLKTFLRRVRAVATDKGTEAPRGRDSELC
jgi:hypothetical protein